MKRTIITGIVLAVAALAMLTVSIRHSEPLESKPLGAISGRVADASTGNPLARASLQVVGTTMGSMTNTDGKYTIKNVVPGSYTLKASVVGYVPQEIAALSVTAGNTTQQDFQLVPTTIACDKPQIVHTERDLSKLSEVQDQRVTTVQELQQAQAGVQSNCGQIHVRDGRSNQAFNRVQPLPKPKPSCFGTPMSTGGSVPPNGQQYDATFFKHYGVNPFVSTDDDHLSTFAIDADNASYSMTRSYLTRGSLPPDEAVRVEEFVNNFKYEYRHPQERAFRVCLEGAPSKFGSKYQLLKIGIVGKKIDECRRQDANLVFVIDVSGSMNMENRLSAVKKALHMLVDNLTDRDRVGIVAYRTDAYEVLPPTSIRDRERIIRAIDDLNASGSTWAEGGLRLGYQMANRCFDRNKINRIILCTDGVANEGQTAAEDILKEIKQYADRGITLSAIGFGMNNYNDVLLEKLGDKGNGHYAYVDNWEEARRIFVENLTGTLQVIARDVKIQVDFNPNTVDCYRLLGYENRDVADNKFRDDKEDGGEIGSGHTVTALYEIKLKDEARGDLGTVYVRYKDPTTLAVNEVAEPIDQSCFSRWFESASSDLRLAAAAAEFAEILRKSYWAQDGHLSDVLRVVGQVERERCDDQVIELMDLVAKADRMMKANEDGQGPLGMETE
ncbi:MAG: von Willebrand factor type A domain-containing protein [candidate division Zixibacteria bacterium]|nr:von Willebrand factor type A domain-containing protein [candidate division Zixibacteria bacterium]